MADKGAKKAETEVEGDVAKKKKGKLPLILVLLLVLGGGGFFMMSKGKADEPEEPPVELGLIESIGDEFVINLKDGKTFLVCQVSVQVAKDGHATDPAGDKGGHGKGGTYAITRDAVNMVLGQKTISEITKPEGMKMLKRELAAAMNHALHAAHPPKKDKKEKKSSKKESAESKTEIGDQKDSKASKPSAKEQNSNDSHGDKGHGIDHKKLDELGWDAAEGPILKVFFDKFMYQRSG
ncbi:flagellar basal body-associated FliL family protein [Kamptonema cortianum]|nr:flagellar basal body-associated FliL family protein [Kamptonema cortianum]